MMIGSLQMSAKGAVRGGALSRLNLFLALCACGAAAPASAQPAQEEVVVTAQRRSENLQRVPISIQAYNAAALKERGITETADLQFHVPGVMVSGGGQNGQRVWIRGIGPNVVGSGVDGNVASYRDGVYLTRSFSGEVPFLDAERVEVLRGPQGTLYGRNATGGAINLVSRDPSYDTTAELVAAYGTDEDRTFTAIVNGGVVDGKLAARLAVSTRRADNAMKNLSHPDYNGYNDYVQAKAAILFEPSEDLRFVLRGDIIDADQLNYAPLVMTSISPASVYGALNFGLGPIPVPSLPTGKFDYRSNLRSAPYKAHDEWGVSLRADWSLDNVKLTAISAYRDMEMSFFTDSTGNSSMASGTSASGTAMPLSPERRTCRSATGSPPCDSRGTTVMSAPMSFRMSMTPVRVGFTPTFSMMYSPLPAMLPATRKNAAEEISPGTSTREPCRVCRPFSRTRGPSVSICTPKPRSMRSVWSRVGAGSVTVVMPSAYSPASRIADFTCALATGSV